MSDGPEDMSDAANEPQDSLESRIDSIARDHFEKAGQHGYHKYYLWLRDSVSTKFADPRRIQRSVDDFLLDRYRFHYRHQELQPLAAKLMSYQDSFEYMISLLNRQGLRNASMKDDWRDTK